MLHRDLDRGVAGERHLAGEHLVEDDSERVEVGALVDRLAAGLLGRQVLRRPDDRARLGHLGGPRARDPEIGHLDVPVGADDHVVRLDVAVDDLVSVRLGERAQDLAGELDRRQRRRRALADEQLLQRRAVEVLHRDVVGVLGLAAVVDADDVRVAEAGGGPRLALEALDELLVTGVTLVQDLQGDLAAELLVLGQVDLGHAAGAELAHDPVAAVEQPADQAVFEVSGQGFPSPDSSSSEGSPASAAWRSERRSPRRNRCSGLRRRRHPPGSGSPPGRRR